MQANWRAIHAARNTFAILYAACEREGISLNPVETPADDVTCYSLTTAGAARFHGEIARAGCITVAGGPHATAVPREVATYADYVVVGEGEYTLPRLLQDLARGGDGRVPGVMAGDWYEPADTGVRLDAYPPFTDYKGYIEISRGCPFSCGYCQTPQLFGRCMRHRSVDEVARYAQKHRQVRFVSPNALAYGSDGLHLRLDKVGRLLEACSGREIFFGTFPCEVRPESVTPAALDLIARYCTGTNLHFGAQSGSDEVLRHLHRGHTTEDVIRAVELCREYAITPIVDFIVGLPFESDADQRETLDLIRWVSRYGRVHLHRFQPLPGTPLAGTTARSLLPETEKLCGTLALSGKLTGSWTPARDKVFTTPFK